MQEKETSERPRKMHRKPAIYSRNFLMDLKLVTTIQNVIATEIKGKTDLICLDVGCGSKPYYPFFASICKDYLGIDIIRNREVNVVASAENLPFRDEIFDLVICTQVLEHVSDPMETISCIHSVLKEKGNLILSTHGVYTSHTSQDFWRFTDQGLEKVLAGFRLVRVLPNGGPIVTLIVMINHIICLFMPLILRNFLFTVNNFIGLTLDRLISLNPYMSKKFWVSNYTAVATK